KGSDGEMVIKVRRVKPPHAQGATPLGGPPLCAPQHPGLSQGAGGQRHASRPASPEEITTAYSIGLFGMCLLELHGSPPLKIHSPSLSSYRSSHSAAMRLP